MGRIARGFRLARASFEVLRSDKQLLFLPLASTAAIIVFSAAVLSPAFLGGLAGARHTLGPVVYLLMAIVYFGSSFIATFSNAAIVAAATERLDGREGSVADGLRTAWSRVDRLLAWSALSASVGLVLRAVEQRGGIVGAIVGRVVGVAWSVVTFFVVPVLVFEPVGPIDAVKRSASLFRQRWGEQLVGDGAIGLALFVLMIPAVLVCLALATVAPILAVLVGIVAFGLLLATGGALTGIFNAALYRYATVGEAGGPFSTADLQSSFRPRRRRPGGGGTFGTFNGGFGGGFRG